MGAGLLEDLGNHQFPHLLPLPTGTPVCVCVCVCELVFYLLTYI